MIETEGTSSRSSNTSSRVQRYQRRSLNTCAEDRRSICEVVDAESQHLLVVRQRTWEVADLKMNAAWMRSVGQTKCWRRYSVRSLGSSCCLGHDANRPCQAHPSRSSRRTDSRTRLASRSTRNMAVFCALVLPC